MTPGQDPGPPPDHATAETYLRLRAEAELRRVEALPRPDPLAAIGIPAPLRGAVRLGLPLGQRAITALEPLAGNAAQTLQPLAESAARTARPLADDAARTLQPLANGAVQAIQPLTNRLAGAVLPAAEQMARRLNPLVWRAAGQLSRSYRFTSGRPRERAELSAEEGLRRLSAVAQALARAGAIDHGTADTVIASMETALAARSRIPPYRLRIRGRLGWRQQRSARPPAGAYLAAPVGVPAATPPESGLRNVHLVTVVIAPDRALLLLVGQVIEADDRSPCDLPAAWASVLENSHRRDGPPGVAPAAAVLPELDGTRFVLAGLRSYPASSRLFAMAWGHHRLPSFPRYPGSNHWSWSARDDQGRWHVVSQSSYRASDQHADLQLVLKPPLHPRATSLEVTLTGPSGQVSATVPLDWRE